MEMAEQPPIWARGVVPEVEQEATGEQPNVAGALEGQLRAGPAAEIQREQQEILQAIRDRFNEYRILVDRILTGPADTEGALLGNFINNLRQSIGALITRFRDIPQVQQSLGELNQQINGSYAELRSNVAAVTHALDRIAPPGGEQRQGGGVRGGRLRKSSRRVGSRRKHRKHSRRFSKQKRQRSNQHRR